MTQSRTSIKSNVQFVVFAFYTLTHIHYLYTYSTSFVEPMTTHTCARHVLWFTLSIQVSDKNLVTVYLFAGESCCLLKSSQHPVDQSDLVDTQLDSGTGQSGV